VADEGDANAQRNATPVAVDEGVDVWRERLTTAVLWCLTASGSVAYAFGVAQGMLPAGHVALPIITVIAFAASIARRANLTLRVAVLLLGMLSASSTAIATVGLAPNGLVALSVGVVAAGLLLGRSAALLYAAACVAAVAAISTLHRTSVLALPADWAHHFDIGDSAVVIRVVAKTLPLKQWDVARELRRRIKNRFDQEGIEIPYPHLSFYWGDQQKPDVPTSTASEAS
jgi:hypothetical protein